MFASREFCFGATSGHKSSLPIMLLFCGPETVLRLASQIPEISGHLAVYPPSTMRHVPVMKEASSEARNRIALATSAVVP